MSFNLAVGLFLIAYFVLWVFIFCFLRKSGRMSGKTDEIDLVAKGIFAGLEYGRAALEDGGGKVTRIRLRSQGLITVDGKLRIPFSVGTPIVILRRGDAFCVMGKKS